MGKSFSNNNDSKNDLSKKMEITKNKTIRLEKEKADLEKCHLFSNVTDIYLFDSKGYEKSESFDHNLIKGIKLNKELMIAGNIQYNDELKKYSKIADFIDLSGGLETSGLKDRSKIEIFLNKVKQLKNEN